MKDRSCLLSCELTLIANVAVDAKVDAGVYVLARLDIRSNIS